MIIKVQNASFSRGHKSIFSNISFEFEANGVLSILGPNGAGKTTFLKTLLGFLPLSSGSISFDGIKVADFNSREFWKKVAYVPQAKPQMLQQMTLAEFVVLGRSPHLGFFRQPGKNDWKIVDKVLDKVGLFSNRNELTTEVSGGQLQLTLIARALAQEPNLLVLDEPESNLDFKNQKIVIDVLQDLKASNYGVVINTHFPYHAFQLSSSCLLLSKKHQAYFGSKELLKDEKLLSVVFDAPIKVETVRVDGLEAPFITVC